MFNSANVDSIKLKNIGSSNSYMFYNAKPTKIYLSTVTAPITTQSTFQGIKSGGILHIPVGYSGYDVGGWTYLLGTKRWTIATESGDLEWDFPTDSINLGCEGGTFEINFASNVEIPNIIISNVPNWLTFSREGNTIIGVATPNGTDQNRSATLEFLAEGFGVTKTLTITQEALDWQLDFTSYEFWSESSVPHNSDSDLGLIFSVSDKLTDLEITINASWLRAESDLPTIQL